MPAPKIRRASKTSNAAPVNAAPVNAEPVNAAPLRRSYGRASDILVSSVDSALRSIAALLNTRGAAASKMSRADFFTFALPDVTRADSDALLLLAARFLVAAGSSIANVTAVPYADVESFSAHFYANRGRHPDTQRVSDIDIRDAACSLASTLIANVDRLNARTIRREYLGRYGNGAGTIALRDSIATTLATLRNAAPAKSDVDAVIDSL